MGYFYDFHVHSNECSDCARTSARDMVSALKNAGYSGFVLTNHFLNGNNCVPKELSWEEKMAQYYNAYLSAKELGDEIDFDVFFGIEYNYGNAQEILVYGIDYDFLVANPDMCDISVYEFCDRVHNYGGFVSHAHPFRERGYIPKGNFLMELSHVDALEIYNSANREVEDEKAQALCRELNLAYTAGNDLHLDSHLANFPNAGLEFDRRIRDNKDLVELLKSRCGRLKFSGERYFK